MKISEREAAYDTSRQSWTAHQRIDTMGEFSFVEMWQKMGYLAKGVNVS